MHKSLFSPVARSWQAYRYENLVYFRHFKCASVYYLQLFDKILQWEQTCITEIDWAKDRVFSYIRNPFEKRIAGLAEYVYNIFREENKDCDFAKLVNLIDHPYFVKIIARTFILDDHTLPIYHILGTKAELVDWIPIDIAGINHVECTRKLLCSYDININSTELEKLDKANVSTGVKKDFIKKLSQQPVPGLVTSDLDYDHILYSHVVSFFNSEAKNWKDVSWLKIHSQTLAA